MFNILLAQAISCCFSLANPLLGIDALPAQAVLATRKTNIDRATAGAIVCLFCFIWLQPVGRFDSRVHFSVILE